MCDLEDERGGGWYRYLSKRTSENKEVEMNIVAQQRLIGRIDPLESSLYDASHLGRHSMATL